MSDEKDPLTEAAFVLAMKPTPSTAHMWHEERADGIRQMLEDLEQLAKRDGCIAAGWALEKLLHVASEEMKADPTP